MKTKNILKNSLVLLCCTLLFSCIKKDITDTSKPAFSAGARELNILSTYTNFEDTDWKGVVWTPFNGDWSSLGTVSDRTDLGYAGIKWDRFWFQANYTTVHMDSVVNIHNATGIKIIACYVKSNPKGDLGTSSEQTTEINNLKAWVTRYKTSIHYWEIGNEINSTAYWNLGNGVGEGSPDSTTPYNRGVHNYILWLQLANTAIHSIDPSATVILGGLSEYHMEAFMDRLTVESAYNYCDEVAFHPYAENNDATPNHSVDRLIAFKNKMTSWTAPKNNMPIWITEVGFHVGNISSPGMVPDDSTKAAYLKETYVKFIQTLPWKRPICWYNFHEATPGLNYYNLINRSTATGPTTYYPAYTTYHLMNTSWDYWVAGEPGTVDMHEAENMTVAANSGDAVTVFTDGLASNSKGSKYASNAVGDSIVYTFPAVTPGSYTIWVRVKQLNTRGNCQLKVTQSGSTTIEHTSTVQDLYASTATYITLNFGVLQIYSTNDQQLIFKVTGKNASSTGYDLAFDYIKLIRN